MQGQMKILVPLLTPLDDYILYKSSRSSLEQPNEALWC
jgi:hypothetical protein